MRLIAHQIIKAQHSLDTKLLLRDALLPENSDLSQNLISQVRTAIVQRNPVAGRFTRIAGAVPAFEQRLGVYLRSTGDAEFITLTQDATKLLDSKMRTEPLATGAYVVYIEHEQQDTQFLTVVLLSPKAQPSFDEKLNLISSVTLDFEHLRHAGRIRIADVPSNADGVVHFVSRRSEATSDYFREFLGCEALTDSTAQANLLFSAVQKLVRSGAMDKSDSAQAMERTYSYWDDCWKNKRAMTLTALANALSPQNPSVVLEHLGREENRLAGEFPPPPPKFMRKFVKFAFSKGGLRIEFDRNDWLDKITVKGRSVTIKDAPEDLIAQLGREKE